MRKNVVFLQMWYDVVVFHMLKPALHELWGLIGQSLPAMIRPCQRVLARSLREAFCGGRQAQVGQTVPHPGKTRGDRES